MTIKGYTMIRSHIDGTHYQPPVKLEIDDIEAYEITLSASDDRFMIVIEGEDFPITVKLGFTFRAMRKLLGQEG